MTIDFIKRQAKQAAKVLPEFLKQNTFPLSHTQCLELVSRLHGFPNYHAAQASVRHSLEHSTYPAEERKEPGPWWCDACGQLIYDAAEGYLIFRSTPSSKYHDFRVVHRRRCDPSGDYSASLALSDVIGDRGLSKLLSFLSAGPLKSPASERDIRVSEMAEFVDLVRRLHTPLYEQMRRHYCDPLWQENLADWNEYAPYIPESLVEQLAWEVSRWPGSLPHAHLCGCAFAGESRIHWEDGDEVAEVTVTLRELELELAWDEDSLRFGFCADGRFRSPLVDQAGRKIGEVVLKVIDADGGVVHLDGQWTEHQTSARLSATLRPQ